ncbi:F-box/LRR-repeat protein 15 [Striga asiatica]|uniref:F-box/LRR-repeat protein 15 n=1 Tax=Striga asiatica TaxID=4170 RepID=A0A5A7PRD5_STRAF|nr:F-box/LRR-repeat protein 15 [Striga asiatica]
MKRVNGIVVSEEGENSRLKKVRFSNGNDENCGDLAINGGEEQRTCVDDGGMNSGQVEKSEGPFEDLVSGDLESPSVGGMSKSNPWDFDLNISLILGNEEEQEGFLFDLNLPTPLNGGPVINEKTVDVIDIASDDSDNEVEVTGYTRGYNNAKGKEIEVEAPTDDTQKLNNSFGESSSLGCLRKLTMEENGEADVVETWLSLKANSPPLLHLLRDSDELIGEEDAEIEMLPLAELAMRPEMAEREQNGQNELAVRLENLARETRQENARRFARVNLAGQSQKLPSSATPVKEFGNVAGPFSDSLTMVRERTSKRSAKKLIEWKPSSENQDKSTIVRFVPSLLDLSLKALAENAEGMISLKMVPDNLRERLTDRLCDTSKMGIDFLKLLLEGCPTEIRVKNSSWLTEKEFHQAFKNCQTQDLRVLQLDLCGQCMLDFAFEDIMSNSLNSFSSLAVVSLRGACRLSDSGIKTLVTSAPLLRSINLGHCSLLTSEAIKFIADSLGSNLRELYIDDCQKINPAMIFPAFRKFEYLEVLSVAGLHGVTDLFITKVISVCSKSIKELDLADCPKLSDCCLKIIGSSCAGLCSLNISNLPNLTDIGLESLANGCRSIQILKMCRNEFSDEVMAAFIESSGESLKELLLNNISKVGPNTAFSLSKRSRKLLSLDISFCRGISDEALGLILDSCSSLKQLKVFGCRQITNVSLNGHSNPNVRIIGSKLSPILDHVNLLQSDGVLLRYSPLPDTQ